MKLQNAGFMLHQASGKLIFLYQTIRPRRSRLFFPVQHFH